MDNNKVLLSQNEIDVLIKFLNSKNESISGEVLEQSSVDKLLHILKSGGQKLYFDSDLPKFKEGNGTAILVLDGESNIGEQQKFCELEYETDPQTGYVKIFCVNKNSGSKYNMTPTCLEQVTYLNGDTTEWGYAVPPLTFDIVAALLQVKYTKATFDKVCETYSKKMFGDKNHPIPSIYMPTSQNLLQHLMG